MERKMARTDIHRPSVINPAEYNFVAYDYYGSYGGFIMETERNRFQAHRAKTGGKWSDHEHGGTCHVCGARAAYVVKYHHVPTNTYIQTGEDCAVKMDLSGTLGMQLFRKDIQFNTKAVKARVKAEEFCAASGLSAAWEIYTANDKSAFKNEEGIICDVIYKLVRYGDISVNQVASIEKLLEQIELRGQRMAERAALDAASKHVGKVGDRTTFEATVTFVTTYETRFGMMTVTGLKDDDGNILIHKGSGFGVSKGDVVQVMATVKEHGVREGVNQTIITRPKLLGMVIHKAA
jgi:hypothetical protein